MSSQHLNSGGELSEQPTSRARCPRAWQIHQGRPRIRVAQESSNERAEAVERIDCNRTGTSCLDVESKALRSSSAPAQSAALEAGYSDQSPASYDDAKREKQAELDVPTGEDAERSRASSKSAMVSETMERQTSESKTRPASASPRAASASIVPESDPLREAVVGQALEDTAVISRDFAAPGDQTESGPIAPQSEQQVHDDEGATPSKRRKSEIAPWMTERHKTAIRRSLGGLLLRPQTPLSSLLLRSQVLPLQKRASKPARQGDKGRQKFSALLRHAIAQFAASPKIKTRSRRAALSNVAEGVGFELHLGTSRKGSPRSYFSCDLIVLIP